MSRPPISEITQTSPDRPAQWEGRMESGEAFYVHYRWGFLTIGFGADVDAAVEATSSAEGYEWENPDADGLDGWIEWEAVEPHFARAWAAFVERRDRKPS